MVVQKNPSIVKSTFSYLHDKPEHFVKKRLHCEVGLFIFQQSRGGLYNQDI